jgi:hypothetical protein
MDVFVAIYYRWKRMQATECVWNIVEILDLRIVHLYFARNDNFASYVGAISWPYALQDQESRKQRKNYIQMSFIVLAEFNFNEEL